MRLFVLRIGKRTAADVIYRIAYGVVYPTTSVLKAPIQSGFNSFGKFSSKELFLSEITMARGAEEIMSVFNDLAFGKSLKQALFSASIQFELNNYDVKFTQEGVETPWLEEDVKERQLNYCKEICIQDPLSLFEVGGHIIGDARKALEALEKKLSSLTRLPFGGKFDHIGNLMITVTPDRDENGKPLIEYKHTKGTPNILHVNIDTKMLHDADAIIVNVRLSVKDRVICDTIKSEKVKKHSCITFVFPYTGPISTSELKVWKSNGIDTLLVHKSMMHFIQQIHFEMCVAEGVLNVESDWLEKIRSTIPENKQTLADDVAKVEHTFTEEHFIKNEGEPSWQERVVFKKRPQLSNDVFFPKGWDKNNKEHGGLAFLEWFKNKTKGTIQVFLQDPYFEGVALLFLSSSGVSTNFTVLTQTHLKTNADGTNAQIPEDEAAKRGESIKRIIYSYPLLFSSMNLVIKDTTLHSNVLHDRYLFFEYKDGHTEGYNLSNSLQGATNKQPLLITEIREPALSKVISHIQNCYNQCDAKVLYDCNDKKPDYSKTNVEVADQGFYNWLCTTSIKDKIVHCDIDALCEDIFRWNTNAKLSTLGYLFANNVEFESDIILDAFAERISATREWLDQLKEFILTHHYDDYPVGYRHSTDRGWHHNDATLLLGLKYSEIVTKNRSNFLDYECSETCSYRVWGQYYACRILTTASPEDTIDVLKKLRPTLLSIKTDKTIHPVYKVTEVLLHMIFEMQVFGKGGELLEVLLKSTEDWCRAIGSLMLLYKARRDDISRELNFITDIEEKIIFCNVAIGCKPDVLHRDMIYKCLVDSFSNQADKDVIKEHLYSFLLESHYLQDKIDYIRNVTMPLISRGFITIKDLNKDLVEKLFGPTIDVNNSIRVQYVLPEALFLIGCSLDDINSKAKEVISSFATNMSKIIIKNDDSIFEAARKPINLRNLLMAILNRYSENNTPNVIKTRELLKELDCKLDNAGLEETKRQFEYK